MDEIIIEDKKYVSSKRAADITGYAKDYVGQLCREGYVSARRVGRSWYVLESAIKDHRFGNDTHDSGVVQEASRSPLPPTWEAPRYEAASGDHLPSINRLHAAPEPQTDLPANDLEDAWQDWFESFRATEPVGEIVPAEAIEEVVQAPRELAPEVVPVHRLQEQREALAPNLIRPPRFSLEKPPRPHSPKRSSGRAGRLALQTALLVLTLFFVCAALFGTGYFDNNPVSFGRLQLISGMAAVEKASK